MVSFDRAEMMPEQIIESWRLSETEDLIKRAYSMIHEVWNAYSESIKIKNLTIALERLNTAKFNIEQVIKQLESHITKE